MTAIEFRCFFVSESIVIYTLIIILFFDDFAIGLSSIRQLNNFLWAFKKKEKYLSTSCNGFIHDMLWNILQPVLFWGLVTNDLMYNICQRLEYITMFVICNNVSNSSDVRRTIIGYKKWLPLLNISISTYWNYTKFSTHELW